MNQPLREGYIVGGNAPPVSHTASVGSRLMQKWGWEPGKGLGKDGAGITAPVTAYVRPRKAGLGACAAAPPTMPDPVPIHKPSTSHDRLNTHIVFADEEIFAAEQECL